MATDFNNVIIIGRLTADPIEKFLPSGDAISEFSIANNYYAGNKNSTEVNYFEAVAYGKTAETINKYLNKGKQIAINGTLRQERWQDKDTNATRSRVRIIVQSIQMLGASNTNNSMDNSNYDNTNNNYSNTSYTPTNMDMSGGFSEEDDDVPF